MYDFIIYLSVFCCLLIWPPRECVGSKKKKMEIQKKAFCVVDSVFCARIARVFRHAIRSRCMCVECSGNAFYFFSSNPCSSTIFSSYSFMSRSQEVNRKRFFTCCSGSCAPSTQAVACPPSKKKYDKPIMASHCRDYSAILIRSRFAFWRSLAPRLRTRRKKTSNSSIIDGIVSPSRKLSEGGKPGRTI